MANNIRVTLEIGPKNKRVVAVAPDWPGLSRGAATAEAAVDRLRTYVPRYAPVAKLAGMDSAFTDNPTLEVVESYQGISSTDFWGISFRFSSIDQQVMTDDELDRLLTLLRACWAFFDDTRSRVSEEMQLGPRGGGKNRDRIVRHTLISELDMSRRVGVLTPMDVIVTEDGLKAHRDAYIDAIREFHAQNKMARSWPLRYLIRHTAFHSLDHAWEMEDKDLTPKLE